MKKRLGEILLERGLIDIDQLNSALAHQRQWGVRLGAALVARGFIAEGQLTQALSEHLGIPMVDLSKVVFDPKVIAVVPRRLCEQHEVLPLGVKEEGRRRVLFLAMADPLNAAVIDQIAFTTDMLVRPCIAQISSLEKAILVVHHGQRIAIPPLDFTARSGGGVASPTPEEPMTITDRGGERVILGREAERVSTTSPPGVDPFAVPPSPDYRQSGQPTGVFTMAPPQMSTPPTTLPPRIPSMASELPTLVGTPESMPVAEGDILAVSRAADLEAVEALEKKFWALMRVLARRGVVTRDEFLAEWRAGEE